MHKHTIISNATRKIQCSNRFAANNRQINMTNNTIWKLEYYPMWKNWPHAWYVYRYNRTNLPQRHSIYIEHTAIIAGALTGPIRNIFDARNVCLSDWIKVPNTCTMQRTIWVFGVVRTELTAWHCKVRLFQKWAHQMRAK